MKRFYFLLLCMVVLALATLAQAQTFTTLYNFTGGTDGGTPYAGVILSQGGDLYGTTIYGGDKECDDGFGCGVVFKLDTAGTETVLHAFPGGLDGNTPVAPVARDDAGNLYGTTLLGGSASNGAIFKINVAGHLPAAPMAAIRHKASSGTKPEIYMALPAAAATVLFTAQSSKLTVRETIPFSTTSPRPPLMGHLRCMVI